MDTKKLNKVQGVMLVVIAIAILLAVVNLGKLECKFQKFSAEQAEKWEYYEGYEDDQIN